MRRLRQLSESLKTKDLYIKKGERRGEKPTSVPAVAEKNIFYPERERENCRDYSRHLSTGSLYIFSTVGAEVYRREKHIHEVLLLGVAFKRWEK